DDLVFQQAQRPSCAAFWRLRTGQRDQFGFRGAIDDARSGRGGECLRVSTASNPSSTSCWRVRAMVARLASKAFAIRLSLQASPASPASAFNRMRAFVNLWAGCLPLRIRLSSRSRSAALSFTTYFFLLTHFPQPVFASGPAHT